MSKSKPLPSQTYLLECFDYSPDTGVLVWKQRPLSHFKNTHGMNIWNAQYSSSPVGWLMKDSRTMLSICKTKYLASRVIWKLMTGNDPTHQVDHININPSDDRWCNLREATPSQNSQNQNIRSDNTSGFKGVSFYKRRNKYQAALQINHKYFFLGWFDTAEEATNAYKIASLKHHKTFSIF